MSRGTAASEGGFTLSSDVSLVIFSFAIAGVLAVADLDDTAFCENRLTSGEEQAVRVPMDFLTDAIRQAAPGVADPTQCPGRRYWCPLGAITVMTAARAAPTRST